MEFNDSFEIPAAPDEVMRRFADVERVSRCVPGLSMEGRDEEGNYLGAMTVSFGPKRLKFQGRVKCDFDMQNHRGTLTGGGAAARAASIQVRTDFTVQPAPGSGPESPRSVVTIDSHADLQGVLAQFASTGGVALGKQLMREFAHNLTQELSQAAGAGAAESNAAAADGGAGPEGAAEPGGDAAQPRSGARPEPARSLSAFGLIWAVIVGKLKELFGAGAR